MGYTTTLDLLHAAIASVSACCCELPTVRLPVSRTMVFLPATEPRSDASLCKDRNMSREPRSADALVPAAALLAEVTEDLGPLTTSFRRPAFPVKPCTMRKPP